MTRGVFSGLVGFTLAGIVLAAVLGRVLPDDWSPGAFAARRDRRGGARGRRGRARRRVARPAAAPRSSARCSARVLLIALQPQADLVTLLSLLAVLAGAAAAALAFSGRSRARRRRG